MNKPTAEEIAAIRKRPNRPATWARTDQTVALTLAERDLLCDAAEQLADARAELGMQQAATSSAVRDSKTWHDGYMRAAARVDLLRKALAGLVDECHSQEHGYAIRTSDALAAAHTALGEAE